jgi:hypothetical protein
MLLFWYVGFSLLVPLLSLFTVEIFVIGGSFLLFKGSILFLVVTLSQQPHFDGCCNFPVGIREGLRNLLRFVPL